ncbi:MAG: peptidoglycan DD-metalloendopeptidase family protein [Methylobacteriaceae bacterium]|nr:peptidoglycan DD-metalloendopeptidase family protein [Methylobacteriaceae bacterium]
MARRVAWLAAGLGLLATIQLGQAQEADPAPREKALRAIEAELERSAEARRRLADEVAAIKADGARLGAALVEAASRTRAAEERSRAIEDRLAALETREGAIRGSFAQRRAALAELLAALQRMGRNPPPALLASPGDILEAVRAAILAGAILPELRAESERLAVELAELTRLRGSIKDERERLATELDGLARDTERLNALVAARRSRLAATEADLAGGRARAEVLAREATSLRELMERLAPKQPKPGEPAAEEESRLGQRFAEAAKRDPVPLAPRLAFADSRGKLLRPASGPVLREFGDPDEAGGTVRGLTIATRPGAVVTASADATIVFSGPFRSLGRLLILNAGGGYYLVLAGLERVHVDVGQFVLAGEPVGQMGTGATAAAFGVVEAKGPVLYVEFRKDGSPIDPGPWWLKSQGEKVRG